MSPARRAARCERVSSVAGTVAFAGLLMLVAHAVAVLTPLNVWPGCAPLGVLLGLPAWIVARLAAQLADRYTDAAREVRP